MDELTHAFQAIGEQEDVRVVLLQSRGKVFSAGTDLADLEEARAAQTTDAFHLMAQAYLDVEVPTIALIEGVASGSACELALLADLVYASDAARFGHPEVGLGTLATVAAALYPTRFGYRVAAEMLLSGTLIDASTAQNYGLITRAIPGRGARSVAMDVTERLSEMSVPLLKATKEGSPAPAPGSSPPKPWTELGTSTSKRWCPPTTPARGSWPFSRSGAPNSRTVKE